MHQSSVSAPSSQPQPDPVIDLSIWSEVRGELRSCPVCGGFRFYVCPLEAGDMPSALLPYQQILNRPHGDRLYTCVGCAEHAGGFSPMPPFIVKRDAASEARLQESERNYATAQLLIWAKKLAMSHLERRGRIKADRTTVPICDTCGQEAPEHGPHCAVGMTLHWINEFVQASPAAPAPRASSAAGDLSPTPAVRDQPDGYFGEVERGALEPEGGAPSYWRGLDGGAK